MIKHSIKWILWKVGCGNKPLKKIKYSDYSDEWFIQEMVTGNPLNTICEDIRIQYKTLKVMYVKAKKMGKKLKEYKKQQKVEEDAFIGSKWWFISGILIGMVLFYIIKEIIEAIV
jgi:hypothetical protein